jgi:hypothetical protein
MAGRPLSTRGQAYDDAKLQEMAEPLTVRIEKFKAGRKSPVPMWDSDSGGTNGSGFLKEEIQRLEGYLLTQWAGGGYYEITVTDPNSVVMKWTPYWNPSEYPELVPPPMQGVVSPDAPPVNHNPQGSRMPPPFQPFQGPQAGGWPQSYSMPAPPPFGSPNYPNWVNESERREEKAEMKRLREESERRDREAREAAHRADLERERAANNERFARLENTLGSLVGTLKEANAAPKGPSPTELAMQAQLETMREEARRATAAAETARLEREADRREQTLREQMRLQVDEAKRVAEDTSRRLEAMQSQLQQTITTLTTQIANAGNKSDPMLAFMQENARQTAEMVKEMARESRNSIEGLKGFMMNPRDMFAMARESQQGVEAAVERTMRMTDGIIQTQQRVMEHAVQMAPQGNGVIDAVTQGMSNVKEFLERLVITKGKEAQAQAAAQASIAQSQAHAIEVNARAANPAAFMPQPGLNAPPPPEPVAPTPPAAEAPRAPVEPERLWGRTDREWFGPALGDVMNLRRGVAEFIAAGRAMLASGATPEAIEQIPGAHPVDAARGIMVGAAVAQQQRVIVPAMVELLGPGLLDEFLTVLLPEATVEYRDEVIKLLKDPEALAKGADSQEPPEPTEPPEPGDEDGDGEDDDDDEAQPAPPPVIQVAKPGPAPTGPRRNGHAGKRS